MIFLVTAPASAEEPGLGSKIAEILPVDEAFRFGSYEDSNGIHLFWQVMPGYYLYRGKISVNQGESTLPVPLPAGEQRMDEVFGEVMVLEGLIEVSIPRPAGQQPVQVSYQGCAEKGYCYPPQKKLLNAEKSRLNSGNVLVD